MKIKIDNSGKLTIPRGLLEKHGFGPGVVLNIETFEDRITIATVEEGNGNDRAVCTRGDNSDAEAVPMLRWKRLERLTGS